MNAEDILIPDSEEWPLSPADEREVILHRFCDRDELLPLGLRLEVEWFEDRERLHRSDEDQAREHITETDTDAEDLEAALNSAIDEYSPRFVGFWGYYYHCELDGEAVVVEEGPARSQWQSVADQLVDLTDDDPQLYALIRGIVANPRVYRDYGRVDFGDAVSKGADYYEGDGNFWPANKADQPGQVPGVTTSSPASGRSYRVARELIPVIQLGLDHRDEIQSGPIETPDQTVKSTSHGGHVRI